jgi:hypothetical protein
MRGEGRGGRERPMLGERGGKRQAQGGSSCVAPLGRERKRLNTTPLSEPDWSRPLFQVSLFTTIPLGLEADELVDLSRCLVVSSHATAAQTPGDRDTDESTGGESGTLAHVSPDPATTHSSAKARPPSRCSLRPQFEL